LLSQRYAMSEEVEPVQVVARIRPGDDPDAVPVVAMTAAGNEVVTRDPEENPQRRKGQRVYRCTEVLGPQSAQEEVYRLVRPLVLSTVKGYNATVFAYGHTGSGKTHTMTGTPQEPGAIPRAIADIFATIRLATQRSHDVMFLVRMSFVELYNNAFRNLLPEAAFDKTASTPTDRTGSSRRTTKGGKIEVREADNKGTFLSGKGLRHTVRNVQEAVSLYRKGLRYRATATTDLNEHSSRSHAVLTFHVESRFLNGSGQAEVRLGKLNLVDLAGSERLSMSHAEGETLAQTQHINLSLSALGDVLSTLSAKAQGREQGTVVPYRNSKLTFLLKDSLGGNSKTLMIANLHPDPIFFKQTLITLMYASRAGRIQNRASVITDVKGESGIHQVTLDIDELRRRLQDRASQFEALNQQHAQSAQENVQLRAKLQSLNDANLQEKEMLELRLKEVITSAASHFQRERDNFMSLEHKLKARLSYFQHKVQEQEQELESLRSTVQELQSSRRPAAEMTEMQKALDMWQGQAAQAKEEVQTLTRTHAALSSNNRELQSHADRLGREVVGLRSANQTLDHDAQAFRTLENKLKLPLRLALSVLSEEAFRALVLQKLSSSLPFEFELLSRVASTANSVKLLQDRLSTLRMEKRTTEAELNSLWTSVKQQTGLVGQGKALAYLKRAAKEWPRQKALNDRLHETLESFKGSIVKLQEEAHAALANRDAQIEALKEQLGRLEEEGARDSEEKSQKAQEELRHVTKMYGEREERLLNEKRESVASLQAKLQATEGELNRTFSELHRAQITIKGRERMLDARERLEEENDHLSYQYEACRRLLDEARSQAAAHLAELSSTRRCLEEKQAELDTASQKLEEVESVREEVEIAHAQAMTRVVALAVSDTARMRQSLQSEEQRAAEATKLAKERTQMFAEEEKRAMAAVQDLTDIKADMVYMGMQLREREAAEEEAKRAQERVQELETLLADHEMAAEDNDRLKDKTAAQEKEIEALRADVEERDARLASFQTQAEALRTENLALMGAGEAHSKQLESGEKALEVARSQIERLQAELLEQAATAAALKADLSGTEESIKEQADEKLALEDRVKEMVESLAASNARLVELEKHASEEQASAQQEIDRLNAEQATSKADHETTLSNLQEARVHLENEATRLGDLLRVAESDQEELQAQFDELKAERSSLLSKLMTAHSQEVELRGELRRVAAEDEQNLEALHDGLQKAEEENRALQQKLVDRDHEISDMRGSVSRTAAEVSELRSLKSEQDQQIARLEEELAQERAASEEFQRASQQAQKDGQEVLQRAQTRVDDLDRVITEKLELEKELRTRIEDLASEKVAEAEQLDSLRTEVGAFATERDQLAAKIAQLVSDAEAKDLEVLDLRRAHAAEKEQMTMALCECQKRLEESSRSAELAQAATADLEMAQKALSEEMLSKDADADRRSAQLERATRRADELQKQLADLNQQVREEAEASNQLRRLLTVSEAKLESLGGRCGEADKSAAEFQAKAQSLAESNAELLGKLDFTEQELRRACEALKAAEGTISTNEEHIAELKRDAREERQGREGAQLQAQSTQQEAIEARTRLAELVEAKAALQDSLTSTQAELASSLDALHQLREERAAAASRIEALQADLARSESARETLQEEVAVLKEAKAHAEGGLMQMRAELDKTKQVVDQLHATHASALEGAGGMQKQLAIANMEVARLNETKDALQATLQEATAKLHLAHENLQATQSEVRSLSDAGDALKEELESKVRAVEAHLADSEAQKARIEHLEQSLREAKDECSTFEANSLVLQDRLQAAETSLEQIRESATSSDAQMAQLVQRHTKQSNELQATREELVVSKQTAGKVKQELLDLRSLLDISADENEQLRQHLKSAKASASAEKTRADTERSRADETAEENRRLAAELESLHATLDAKAQELIGQSASLQSELAESRQKLLSMEREVEAKRQVTAAEKATLQEELARAKKEVAHLSAQTRQSEEALHAKQSEFDRERIQMAAASAAKSSRLEDAEARAQQLSAEVQQLRQLITAATASLGPAENEGNGHAPLAQEPPNLKAMLEMKIAMKLQQATEAHEAEKAELQRVHEAKLSESKVQVETDFEVRDKVYQDEIRTLEEKLAQAEQQEASLRNSLEAQKSRTERLAAVFAQVRSDMKETEGQLTLARAESESEISKHLREINLWQSKFQLLDDGHRKSLRQLEGANETLADVMGARDQANRQRDDLSEQLQALRKRLQDANSEIDALKSKAEVNVAEMDRRIAELADQHDREISFIHQENETHLRELAEQHEKELRERERAISRSGSEVNRMVHEELSALKATYTDRLQKLENDSSAQMAALQHAHALELEKQRRAAEHASAVLEQVRKQTPRQRLQTVFDDITSGSCAISPSEQTSFRRLAKQLASLARSSTAGVADRENSLSPRHGGKSPQSAASATQRTRLKLSDAGEAPLSPRSANVDHPSPTLPHPPVSSLSPPASSASRPASSAALPPSKEAPPASNEDPSGLWAEAAATEARSPSSALHFIGPHRIDPMIFAERVSAAAIEGNSIALSKILHEAGIHSMKDDCNCLRSTLLPLHRAVSGFHFHGNKRLLMNTLGTLLNFGADVEQRDHYGNTITAKAIQTCTNSAVLPVLKLLLKGGAPTNVANSEGDTPIHAEMKRLRRDSSAVIELLVSHGADINATDRFGETAWQIFMKLVSTGKVPPYGAKMLRTLLESGSAVTSPADVRQAQSLMSRLETGRTT